MKASAMTLGLANKLSVGDSKQASVTEEVGLTLRSLTIDQSKSNDTPVPCGPPSSMLIVILRLRGTHRLLVIDNLYLRMSAIAYCV